MTLDEYQANAIRTAKKYESLQANLIRAALETATEGGEFTTEVKRFAIYDKPFEAPMHAHMVEELGDLMWYVALACNFLDVQLSDVMEANITKLKLRFPQQYSNQDAEARKDKGGLNARVS